MEECCDICGDIGVSDAIITCSQCKINCEHMYCMKNIIEEHIDDWRCEECESSSKQKPLASCPTGELPCVSKSNNSVEVRNGGDLRSESRKLLNESRGGSVAWERMVATGKTIMLSSGEKKSLASSNVTCHSKPPRPKVAVQQPERRSNLGFLSKQGLASGNLQPPKPQRLGNMEISERKQPKFKKLTEVQRSTSRLQPSEAPTNKHMQKEQPTEIQSPQTKARRLMKKPSSPPSPNNSPVTISAPRAPLVRKGRGRAKGKKIKQRTANGDKIHVKFDKRDNTWKSLGVDGSLYDSAVGILTRDYCEPFHHSWAEIPLHQRTQVFDGLLDYFSVDYTYRNGVLRGMVERDAKKCYRNWKSDLHDHFKKNGGLENLARARASVPSNVQDSVHWQRVCDMFISDKWQRTSSRNKRNRDKQQWDSIQGRISYTRHRSKKANMETREPLSLLDNWKDMHTREDVWVNSEAEQTYRRLQERFAQALAADPEHVDEHAIMREVLGQRRGHMNGVGPTLPRKTLAATQPTITSSTSVFEEQQRLIQELQGQVQTIAASHGHLTDFVATMREMFTQLYPNTPLPVFPPPPPPPPISGAPSSSTAHQPDENDESENLGD